MTGEEFSGPPAPKVTRLLYFAGAGCKYDAVGVVDVAILTQ